MTQPYSTVSSTSALSIRILSSRGALGRSYSSRVYFRKLHHALRMRRSTSMTCRSALWLTFPPRYTNSVVWWYTWLAASTLNMAVDSGISFARKYGEAKRRTLPRSLPSSFLVARVIARRPRHRQHKAYSREASRD